MNNVLRLTVLCLCVTTAATAAAVPEIDSSSVISGMTLLGGLVLVIRSHRRK